MRPPSAIAIFARSPVPGQAKTRLIPHLGVRGAAHFQAALILDTLRKVKAVESKLTRYLFVAGPPFPIPSVEVNCRLEFQHGTGLGERLRHAFELLLRRHERALVIGTDSPDLTPGLLRQGLEELRVCDAVLGPCPDGGFYLIGLRASRAGARRRLAAGTLARVRWGSRFAFRDVLQSLLRKDLSCSILEPVRDIDRPRDFESLRRAMGRKKQARRHSPSVWRFLAERGRLREDWKRAV